MTKTVLAALAAEMTRDEKLVTLVLVAFHELHSRGIVDGGTHQMTEQGLEIASYLKSPGVFPYTEEEFEAACCAVIAEAGGVEGFPR